MKFTVYQINFANRWIKHLRVEIPLGSDTYSRSERESVFCSLYNQLKPSETWGVGLVPTHLSVPQTYLGTDRCAVIQRAMNIYEAADHFENQAGGSRW